MINSRGTDELIKHSQPNVFNHETSALERAAVSKYYLQELQIRTQRLSKYFQGPHLCFQVPARVLNFKV